MTAIEILENRCKHWEKIKRMVDYQKRAKIEIESSDLDEYTKQGRMIRLVGDPLFYDSQEHTDILNALNILRNGCQQPQN